MKKYKNPMKAVREIREELQSILKDYHYNSDSEQMSKDVVTALENLIGGLKWVTLIGVMVHVVTKDIQPQEFVVSRALKF